MNGDEDKTKRCAVGEEAHTTQIKRTQRRRCKRKPRCRRRRKRQTERQRQRQRQTEQARQEGSGWVGG